MLHPYKHAAIRWHSEQRPGLTFFSRHLPGFRAERIDRRDLICCCRVRNILRSNSSLHDWAAPPWLLLAAVLVFSLPKFLHKPSKLPPSTPAAGELPLRLLRKVAGRGAAAFSVLARKVQQGRAQQSWCWIRRHGGNGPGGARGTGGMRESEIVSGFRDSGFGRAAWSCKGFQVVQTRGQGMRILRSMIARRTGQCGSAERCS